jgi:hypothetical protein
MSCQASFFLALVLLLKTRWTRREKFVVLTLFPSATWSAQARPLIVGLGFELGA